MSVEALSAFIAEYIAGRRQTKLEAFDKEAAKRSDTDSATLAAERRELELRYEPKAWLTDAAKRAGQINLVTHVAKFTHGDSKAAVSTARQWRWKGISALLRCQVWNRMPWETPRRWTSRNYCKRGLKAVTPYWQA